MASPRTPTLLHPPPSLPFPCKITLLLASPGSHIPRGTNILYYEYSSHGIDVDAPTPTPSSSSKQKPKGETRTGAWECPVEGEVVRWLVAKGDVIRDASKPIVEILEPCRHEEQVNGLCLICLKDVSGVDYSGFSDQSRATVAMVHDAASITVSPEVAARLEHENQLRLLGSRKLSLVVDLDQTIIQATVDPTVGEWIDQGRAYEEGKEGVRRNPNWEALRDVGRFKLSEERKVNGLPGGGAAGRGGKFVQRGKREETVYYIKPRPGLHDFLTRLSALYEMHVYTMGTRSYASQVVRLIDPHGTFFGSRVLSRDESGSLTFKSLTRLFPCNTSSAVIIDDRADVWELSRANLVKVVPYDFFSVGDINGTFLPPPSKDSLLPGASNTPPASPSPSPTAVSPSPSSSSSDEPPSATDLIPTVALALEEAEEEEAETRQKLAMERLQEQKLQKDRESRPLRKLMEELEARERGEREARGTSVGSGGSGRSRSSSRERGAEELASAAAGGAEENGKDEGPLVAAAGEVTNGHVPPAAAAGEGSDSPSTTVVQPDEEEPPTERALLTNDDHELSRVLRILEEIHQRYFQQYDLYASSTTTSSTSTSERGGRKEPSVMEIIPEMKASVLAGVHLVFSSLIPIDTPPQSTDLWRQALQFGASCYTRVTREVTHVVAAKRGTEKVRQALARGGGVRVVNPWWFLDSVAGWERKREEEYPLDGLEAGGGTPPLRAEAGTGQAEGGEGGGEGGGGVVTHPASPGANGRDSPGESENGDALNGVHAPENEEGEAEGEEGEDLGEDVDFGELDWGEMDQELEDLMEEDDGDDSEGEGGGDYPDDPDREEEGSDASRVATRGRKRRRGESGAATPQGSEGDEEEDERGGKRRRRGGGSLMGRANEEILEASQVLVDGGEEGNGHDAADDDGEEEEDEDDDFLARDLEGMEQDDEDGEEEGEEEGG